GAHEPWLHAEAEQGTLRSRARHPAGGLRALRRDGHEDPHRVRDGRVSHPERGRRRGATADASSGDPGATEWRAMKRASGAATLFFAVSQLSLVVLSLQGGCGGATRNASNDPDAAADGDARGGADGAASPLDASANANACASVWQKVKTLYP